MIKCGIEINQTPDVCVGAMVELAQEAERLGYASCWVCDQGLDTRDIYVVLTAIAQRTSRIRLGTGVTNPYSRHPALTAASIASLNELSGGRAFLGLGAGGLDTLWPFGYQRPRPLTAVRDAIYTTRALWRGETVTFDNGIFRFSKARIDFGRPDIEIWIASRSHKMLALGGELADGVMLDFIHKDTLVDFVESVRAGAAISGNQPRLCYATMLVTSERALEQIRPVMFYRLVEPMPNVKELLGLTDADSDTLRRAFERGGLAEAAKFIKDDWVRPMVIMGTEAECAAELNDLMPRLGMDEFIVPILDMETAGDQIAQAARVLAGS